MTDEKALTIKFLAALLFKRGLLNEAQHTELLQGGEIEQVRLQKDREAHSVRRVRSIHEVVSPAETISSFGFTVPEAAGGGELTEDKITELLADEVGLPYLKIDPLKLNLDIVTSNIPRPFAQRHLVVPVGKKEGRVIVAVADPFNLEAIESLTRTAKLKISLVLSSKSDIIKTVREFYGFRSSVVAAQREMSKGDELGNLEQYVRLKGDTEIEATDQHVVNAVEYMLHYAYDQRASDIHIEPKRNQSLVRMRIDGILHNIHTIPKPVHPSVVSRIKMLSRLDIAEKRKPQDGRIKTDYRDREVELRISTMPTAFGEKVVIRIFDPNILFHDLEELGFEKDDFQLFTSFLNKSHGLILVTGPTGSGKTTTLYSALKSLSSPEVNIITIEDPIEMIMEDFNQIGVQPQAGIEFANSLRTILRQDPDIIMVGEIRDPETATNAVQAALTGHLVFSTLHTNDAPSSITRLTELGVPSFLISSSVVGIIAQRLVREICTGCKRERQLDPGEIESLSLPEEEYTVSYGEGCIECRGTGYRGRTGIFEVMQITDNIKAVMDENVDLEKLRAAVKADGIKTLKEAAIKKLLDGITTPEEVIASTG